MTENNLEKDIIAIMSDITGYDAEEITLATNIIKDLEVDSIKAIEITVAIEKKYKIAIREEDVPKIVMVREAIELVQKSLSQSGVNVKF
jgi:acyl carrier protein